MGRIIFYPNCDQTAGFGHVTRCSALADELTAEGSETIFACSANFKTTLDYLAMQGQAVLQLSSDGSAADDLTEIKRLAGRQKFDWLVVDSYKIDSDWLKSARSVAGRLAVIDDHADRYFDCDLLLNQNPGFDHSYEGLLPPSAVSLLGPEYALLRSPFTEARKKGVRVRDRVSRVLVFMGGNDEADNTLSAVKAMDMLKNCEISLDIVISDNYQHRPNLVTKLEKSVFNWEIHQNVDAWEMADLTSNADLALGAAGSASWERCCLGLPAVLLITAENQRRIAEELADQGAAISIIADDDVNTVANIASAAMLIIDNVDKLSEMSQKCYELVDGRGAVRVADAIASL